MRAERQAAAPGGPSRLDALVAGARADLDRRMAAVPVAVLERRAQEAEPRGRAFRAALSKAGRVNVIAECKRRSPSRGLIRPDYDPAVLAAAYERGGAAAVSVLTDADGFGGSLADLGAVRLAVNLPLVRKDFVLTEYQVLEARAAGADAVLLIAAALDRATLAALTSSARALGLAVLAEVHNEAELEVVLDLGVELVGINCRDLHTFDVDLRTADRLISRVPPEVVAVAESGIRSPDEIARLAGLGYRAFLVGEALAGSADPEQMLAAWIAELGRCG